MKRLRSVTTAVVIILVLAAIIMAAARVYVPHSRGSFPEALTLRHTGESLSGAAATRGELPSFSSGSLSR